jgi:hypothetical protein
MNKTKENTYKLLDSILKHLYTQSNFNMLTTDLIKTIKKVELNSNIKLEFDGQTINSEDIITIYNSNYDNFELTTYFAIEYLHKNQLVFYNHQGRHVSLTFDGLMKLHNGGFSKEHNENKVIIFFSKWSNIATIVSALFALGALLISIFRNC